jgi:hypothetical protein
MHDLNGITAPAESTSVENAPQPGEVVSTHVLVREDQVEALRELSRRTRVAQSEYLREAVDDLLQKYQTVLGAPHEGVKR